MGHEGGVPAIFRGRKPAHQEQKAKHPRASAVPTGSKIHVPRHLSQRAVGMLVDFPGATAELNEHSKKQLRGLLPEILGKPQKIEIRGYTTRRPLPADSNYDGPWQLCYARCVAAMEYLVEQGIESNRIRLSQAGIYGSRAQPPGLDGQQDKSGVEIFLLPELAESPPGVAPRAGPPTRSGEPEPQKRRIGGVGVHAPPEKKPSH